MSSRTKGLGDSAAGARVSIPLHAMLQSGESAERGRAARTLAPRAAHGEWAPAPNRPDPIEVLTAQAATRLAELVPIRYGRMPSPRLPSTEGRRP